MAVDIEREDAIYLKRELLLRMGVQNGVIMLNAVLFLVTADLQFLLDRHPAPIALGFSLFTAILASVWCHHGARQRRSSNICCFCNRAIPWMKAGRAGCRAMATPACSARAG